MHGKSFIFKQSDWHSISHVIKDLTFRSSLNLCMNSSSRNFNIKIKDFNYISMSANYLNVFIMIAFHYNYYLNYF